MMSVRDYSRQGAGGDAGEGGPFGPKFFPGEVPE